jgi:YD repeat-containing protein
VGADRQCRDVSGCTSCAGGGGRQASVTDPANRTTHFEYVAKGRLWRKTYSGETGYVEFGYDAADRRTSMLDTRLPAADLGGQTSPGSTTGTTA